LSVFLVYRRMGKKNWKIHFWKWRKHVVKRWWREMIERNPLPQAFGSLDRGSLLRPVYWLLSKNLICVGGLD
jgi:hypothetical protein